MRHLDQNHRYERLDAIASGGMGTVYLGRMLAGETSRTVAIKVLHPHLAKDSNMVAMFLDEARVATRLRHANLVGVLDMDILGEELVIVMEYVEGLALSHLLQELNDREERLSVSLTARVFCDVLAGLHAAHEIVDSHGGSLGLVHRDVSPHNVLVGTDGVSRVTDFGVALVAGRIASTQPGTIKGKLQYLAPEQLGRKKLDRRVDLFAAGATLWECLTGQRLFDAATEAEVVARVLRDPIPPPSLSNPEVSPKLDEVCLRALERDPDRRYRSAAEFAAAFRAAVGTMAEPRELGALVSELAHETIEQHRATLVRAEAGLGPMESEDSEHEEDTEEQAAPDDELEDGGPDDASSMTVPEPPAARTIGSLIGVALVLVLVGGVVVHFMLPSRNAASAPTPPQAVTAASVATGPSAAPSDSSAAQPTAEQTAARPEPSTKAPPSPARRDAGAPASPRRPGSGTSPRPFMPQDL